ncbi:hypothetical protein B0I35DRAFT_440170 [Stachybotrys elegans]|uniref:NACHT domain-containing protein n=1 Tax=Stachybotrys elegans TaxID=80388 RepID=A0A8K0SNC0_9HYPO|nr:hypothetical protein B0I35DRAFT_440170 [Stachybotrys elegans]
MDPLSALGIAAAVVQFIDFGTRLVSTAGEIYQSPSGRTENEVSLTTVASDLAQLSTAVSSQTRLLNHGTHPQGSTEALLLEICEECDRAANELDNAISSLRKKRQNQLFKFGITDRTTSTKHSLSTALKTIRSFDAPSWNSRLADLRMRMMTALLGVLWYRTSANSEVLTQLLAGQSDIVKSLDRLETSLPGKDSLVPIAHAAGNEGSEHRRIIDYIWSPASQTTGDPMLAALGVEEVSEFASRFAIRIADHEDSQLRLYTGAIANSLRVSDITHREESIPEAYRQTYAWIYDTPQQPAGECDSWVGFTAWLEGPAKDAYWITGKPGAGKSTLMKFVTHNEQTRTLLTRWSGNRPLIMASFYFWSAGVSSLQKSQKGLLMALLLQCLEQMPSLCPKICPRRWALFRIFGPNFVRFSPEWTWAELLESFSALTSLMGKDFNLALFIDGLDEFEGNHEKLVEFVKLFHGREGAKVLVSSRPENIFLDAFVENPSLRMEEFTKKDMEIFVQGKFNQTRGYYELTQANPAEAKRLTIELIEKAKGVFLWVSVVSRDLCEGLTEGSSLKELRALLDSLPLDLSDLYSGIWMRIRPEYRPQASQIFQIRREVQFYPHAVDLYLADMDNEETLAQDVDTLEVSYRKHITQTVVRRLNSRTRGLLEVVNDGIIDYLHRSVHEWAIANWDNIKSISDPKFDPNLAILKALVVQTKTLLHNKMYDCAARFWLHTSHCLFHACLVRDEPENIEFFLKLMDYWDKAMATASVSQDYADGSRTLYRNEQNDRLIPKSTRGLPHWATTLNAINPGQSTPYNAFLGLAAQSANYVYVKARVLRDPDLLQKPDPQYPVILACATLGSECFMDPYFRGFSYPLEEWSKEGRVLLIQFLLEKGASASDTKSMKGLLAQIATKLQSGMETGEQDWYKVAALFDKHLHTNLLRKKLSLWSRLSRALKGRGDPVRLKD